MILPLVDAASQSGSYRVQAVVGRCTSAFVSVWVQVYPRPAAPMASFANRSTICEGQSVTLQANSPLSGLMYQWTGPGGFVSTLQHPVMVGVSTAQSGVYSVVVSQGPCTSEAGMVSIGVQPLPALPQPAHNGPLCVGQTLGLTAENPEADVSYSWAGPGGYVSNFARSSIGNASVMHSGIYTLTAHRGGCESRSLTTVVNVWPVPDLPVLQQNGPLCGGETLQLSATGVSPIGSSYLWTGPDHFSSTLRNPSITGVGSGQQGFYSLTVVQNGCTSAVATIRVQVSVSSVGFERQESLACLNRPFQLSINGQSGWSCVWIPPPNSGVSLTGCSLFLPNVQPLHGGAYFLYLTQGRCSVLVRDVRIFTQGCKMADDDVIGVAGMDADCFRLYPNPTQGAVRVSIAPSTEPSGGQESSTNAISLTLQSMTGQILQTWPLEIGMHEVDLTMPEIVPGVYTLIFKRAEKHCQQKLIISE